VLDLAGQPSKLSCIELMPIDSQVRRASIGACGLTGDCRAKIAPQKRAGAKLDPAPMALTRSRAGGRNHTRFETIRSVPT